MRYNFSANYSSPAVYKFPKHPVHVSIAIEIQSYSHVESNKFPIISYQLKRLFRINPLGEHSAVNVEEKNESLT